MREFFVGNQFRFESDCRESHWGRRRGRFRPIELPTKIPPAKITHPRKGTPQSCHGVATIHIQSFTPYLKQQEGWDSADCFESLHHPQRIPTHYNPGQSGGDFLQLSPQHQSYHTGKFPLGTPVWEQLLNPCIPQIQSCTQCRTHAACMSALFLLSCDHSVMPFENV